MKYFKKSRNKQNESVREPRNHFPFCIANTSFCRSSEIINVESAFPRWITTCDFVPSVFKLAVPKQILHRWAINIFDILLDRRLGEKNFLQHSSCGVPSGFKKPKALSEIFKFGSFRVDHHLTRFVFDPERNFEAFI